MAAKQASTPGCLLKCTQCGAEKPPEDFKQRHRRCRECRRKTYASRYATAAAFKTRVCTSCGEEKPLAEFRMHRTTCQACERTQERAAYAADPIAAAAKAREWRKSNPEKTKEIHSRWYQRNANKKKAYAKNRRDKDLEEYRKYKREWYARDPEKSRECARKFRQNNPEYVRDSQSARRARKKGAGGTHNRHQIAELHKKQKGKCAYCRKSLRSGYHRDHIIPLCKGGGNSIRNIQLLCETCNLKKGAKDPIAHAQSLGMLL